MKVNIKFLFILFISSIYTKVIIKNDYIEPQQDFRAIWVTSWGGDEELIAYENEESFKKNMYYILDTLKKYNMNTLIYHIRTHNNALYKSKLNPIASCWSKVDFNSFDPLKWMIKETHKRGIQFHAWLNPYRVTSNSKQSLEEVTAKYKNYPLNPASKVNNLLKGKSMILMDPGLQNVREFIIDTVIEIMDNYDIDAIHFDDYFYADMGANGRTTGDITILDEPDKITYNNYIDTHPECKYSKTNAKDKANWRREQVDEFILQLSIAIKDYNKKNNKFVELGISPTGVYKNGDGEVSYDEKGNAITSGSLTTDQEHYASYLFCDTLKWINNEWISYILPQSYWSIDNPHAGYKILMGWWNKVVKYKKVNLYSGIGLYMCLLEARTYGWKSNPNEFGDQIIHLSTLEYAGGLSIYNFATFRHERDGKKSMASLQVNKAFSRGLWKNIVPPVEIKSFDRIELSKVKHFKIEEKKISFNRIDGVKFYVIYESINNLTFDSSEIIDIFADTNNSITWNGKCKNGYYYGVRALSYSNTLGEGVEGKEETKNLL